MKRERVIWKLMRNKRRELMVFWTFYVLASTLLYWGQGILSDGWGILLILDALTFVIYALIYFSLTRQLKRDIEIIAAFGYQINFAQSRQLSAHEANSLFNPYS